jgi:hypothetical protein
MAKKWEYVVVAGVHENGFTHIKGTSTNWSHRSFVEFLNSQGILGWELVDIEHISKKAGFLCTFKRPVSED